MRCYKLTQKRKILKTHIYIGFNSILVVTDNLGNLVFFILKNPFLLKEYEKKRSDCNGNTGNGNGIGADSPSDCIEPQNIYDLLPIHNHLTECQIFHIIA